MRKWPSKKRLIEDVDVVEGKLVIHCRAFTNSNRRVIAPKHIVGAYANKMGTPMGVYRGYRDVQAHDKQPLVTAARWASADRPATLIKRADR